MWWQLILITFPLWGLLALNLFEWLHMQLMAEQPDRLAEVIEVMLRKRASR